MGDLEPHLIHVSLGQVHNPKGISIGLAVSDRVKTDRPHYSVCKNRLQLHSSAVWPNNKAFV